MSTGSAVSSVLAVQQRSIFGDEPPSADPRFGGLERHALGHGAWVDRCPGWMSGHQHLFDQLLDIAEWQAHDRPMYDRIVAVPRLLGRLPEARPQPAVIDTAAALLGARYGAEFDRVSLALYRSGADGVAWHGDTVARDAPEALVATVSLGEPRRFMLRPNTGGGSVGFTIGHGDLVVMGGTCQRTWQHKVPKAAHAGPRIALMFRPSATSSPPRIAGEGPPVPTTPGWRGSPTS